MNAISAIRTGVARSFGAPRLLLLLWVVNLAVALPLTVVLGAAIQDSIGHSVRADRLAAGFDTVWHSELEDQARGIETTFDPSRVGVGAFLDNLEAWWTGRLLTGGSSSFPGIVAVGVLYALLWAFLLGGVLQRFARPEGFEGQVLSQVFFGNCGRFFTRFVRLALFSGVLYLAIYGLARLYFGTLGRWTRDVTSETTVLIWVLVGAAGVVTLLILVRMLFDLAKVMAVLEDRHGMLVTLWAALRVLVTRPWSFLGLYLGLGLAWLLLLGLYALLAPNAGPTGWLGLVLALLLAQAVLAAKIGLRLSLLAGEMALYRDSLAPILQSSTRPSET